MIIDIKGIIVNERNYSDNDKIITIFSIEGNLIQVKVAGVRKIKSHNRGKIQMFTICEFNIAENHDRFSVLRSVNVIESNNELKIDIEKYYYSLYFCEMITKIGYYNTLDSVVYAKFIAALNRLKNNPNFVTTRYMFELEILKELGLKPNLNACVVCGKTDIISLDPRQGGFICCDCYNNTMVKYSMKTLAVLKAMVNSSIETVGNINISKEVEDELKIFLNLYIEYHLNISFNTKEFI